MTYGASSNEDLEITRTIRAELPHVHFVCDERYLSCCICERHTCQMAPLWPNITEETKARIEALAAQQEERRKKYNLRVKIPDGMARCGHCSILFEKGRGVKLYCTPRCHMLANKVVFTP